MFAIIVIIIIVIILREQQYHSNHLHSGFIPAARVFTSILDLAMFVFTNLFWNPVPAKALAPT